MGALIEELIQWLGVDFESCSRVIFVSPTSYWPNRNLCGPTWEGRPQLIWPSP
jgi:hypothetical protein